MITKLELQSTADLIGKKLHAMDGTIGHVKDFYFDDRDWMIRYLVVDTGSWLPGRQVLLSPHAFGDIGSGDDEVQVSLSKREIEDSPSIETHIPVSRQYETAYHTYYGWPPYWEGSAMLGFRPVETPELDDTFLPKGVEAHLQSVLAVHGYHIKAMDGELGHLEGFLISPNDWKIQKLVIETGMWHLGREIHLSPDMIESFSYEESRVFVRLTKGRLLAREAR